MTENEAYSLATRLFAIACAENFSPDYEDYENDLETPWPHPEQEPLETLSSNWRVAHNPRKLTIVHQEQSYEGLTWQYVQIRERQSFSWELAPKPLTVIRIGKWIIFGHFWAD